MNVFLEARRTEEALASLTPAQHQFAQSIQFDRLIQRLKIRSEQRVKLAISYMSYVALDPQHSVYVDDFVPAPTNEVETDCTVIVVLRYHRVTDIIGALEIERNSPLLTELREAVAANLASKMFKAARLSRHNERMYMRRSSRIKAVGHAAGLEMQQKLEQIPRYKDALTWRPHDMSTDRMATREVYQELIRKAKYDAIEPLKTRLHNRYEAIGRQAYHPAYRESFTALLVHFMKTHLLEGEQFADLREQFMF